MAKVTVEDNTARYGIGFSNGRFVLFAALAPTQCVLGLIWGRQTFEVCVGPFVIGFARLTD